MKKSEFSLSASIAGYPGRQAVAGSFWKVIADMGGVAGAVVAAIIVGALYVGREIFIPIALAILLSFALAPLVRMLQRLRLPRAAAVLLVVLFAFAGIFAVGGLLASESGIWLEICRATSLRCKDSIVAWHGCCHRNPPEGGRSSPRSATRAQQTPTQFDARDTRPWAGKQAHPC